MRFRELGKIWAETGIHSIGMENIDRPTVFVVPELTVCFHFGFAAFAVPQEQLRALGNGSVAA